MSIQMPLVGVPSRVLTPSGSFYNDFQQFAGCDKNSIFVPLVDNLQTNSRLSKTQLHVLHHPLVNLSSDFYQCEKIDSLCGTTPGTHFYLHLSTGDPHQFTSYYFLSPTSGVFRFLHIVASASRGVSRLAEGIKGRCSSDRFAIL